MTKPTGKPVGRPPKIETVVASAVAAALQNAKTPAGVVKPSTRIQNRYDAGGNGRRMVGWNPPKTSPNTAIAQLEKIRERARDSSRNDWATTALVQKWTTTLVGIGITPRWKQVKAKARNKAVVQLFKDWSDVADADGVLDYFGLTSLAVRTWFDGGECFARRRPRFPDAGYPVPFQVQLLEGDMVPLLDATNRPGLPINNVIRSGIEFDRRGQRVAYWVYKQHPGDNLLSYNGDELVRVAASDMIHMFEPKRPGQIRGISETAPILARLRNVADYEDATLERQKIANLFVAFLKHTVPAFDPNAGAVDPITNLPLEPEGSVVGSTDIAGMQPGLFQELGEGEEVQFSNPPEAGTTYSDYIRTTQLGTAAGGGMPYEFMSGDILNISDRALRIVVNEFRRLAEQRQWQVLIPMFCQRIINWFADAAAVMDLISVRELDSVRRVEHSPHGWPLIHPTQDIEGQVAAVNAGFRSQSSVIAAAGDDPEQVAEEQQADDQRMKRLKIGPYSEAAALAAAPAAGAAPAEPTPDPAKAAQARAEIALLNKIVKAHGG